MLLPLLLTCVIGAAIAAPASYDQRQDGDFNVRADVQNVLFLIALPEKIPSSDLLGFLKSSKRHHDNQLQERADIHVMDAFVEPNTPYHVEIGTASDRSAEGDGRAVEVVISGRRNISSDSQEDELKLLGATEQCGPDRERDPVSLTCRDKQTETKVESVKTDSKVNEPAIQPEVVPVSS
ncbi:uncharacterized protein ACR2FA_002769 [Aphomia sociella]